MLATAARLTEADKLFIDALAADLTNNGDCSGPFESSDGWLSRFAAHFLSRSPPYNGDHTPWTGSATEAAISCDQGNF